MAVFPHKTVSDLEQRLDNFRVLFAYHSGKIENEEITLHDTREIFENGKVLNYTGSPRAIFEQQNQKLCYEFLKEKIAAKELNPGISSGGSPHPYQRNLR